MSQSYEDWFVSLAQTDITLGAAYDSLRAVGMRQEQIPFIVQLIENPRFDLPLIDLFPGATDLETHDYIHLILGRGLLPKDEAFVLGFTMGSTNRLSVAEERLYEFFVRYLYPKSYRFSDDEVQVFRDAVRLGYVSDCQSLAGVDYRSLQHITLAQARSAVGLEVDLLTAYYGIEKRRYPRAKESQRL